MGGQLSKSSTAATQEKRSLKQRDNMGAGQDEEGCLEAGCVDEKEGVAGPSRAAQALPLNTVAEMPRRILQNAKNRLALTALSASSPKQILMSQARRIADQQIFNTKLPFEGAPMTNQRSSGRCWIFASTNVFRVALMKKYNLDAFELSQAYLFYWDKLEKSNWFLEQMIDTAAEPLDGRLVQTLLGDPVSDGGQWDMAYNLVNKYGLVPQVIYPDSWNAKNSGVLNSILTTKLREFALTLRRMVRKPGQTRDTLDNTKADMMGEVQQVLTLLLGPPPNPTQAFTWQYKDAEGRAHDVSIKPVAFARDIWTSELRLSSAVIEGMLCLVHDARHEPLTLLTVSRLGNVVGGRDISYINVDMETIKSACVHMIKAGLPVFFGCDVGKSSDSSSGVMDTALFDWEVGLGTGLDGMSKAQRLQTGQSQMTHAMVLTAVHVDEQTGRPVRWRVQNSWGADSGDKGWFVMADAWMDEYVFEAVVDARFCSKEVRQVVDSEAVVLPLWDPMGSLAAPV